MKQQRHKFIWCFRMLHATGLGPDICNLCNYVKFNSSVVHWWLQNVTLFFFKLKLKTQLVSSSQPTLKIKIMTWKQSEKVFKSLLSFSPFVFLGFRPLGADVSIAAALYFLHYLTPWIPRASSIDAMDFFGSLSPQERGAYQKRKFLKCNHGSLVIIKVGFNGDREEALRRYFPVINWASLHSKLRKIQKSIILNVSYLLTLMKPPE